MAPEQPKNCPSCGEPLEADWRICPACEAALTAPTCPGCGNPVREHWKRCPACEVRLTCPTCGRRLPGDGAICLSCGQPPSSSSVGIRAGKWTEPVSGMEFTFVPGGEFLMGDAFGDGVSSELPVHRVRLDGFYLGRYPVTQAQWMRVLPKNPSRFSGSDLPVDSVTFGDVHAFINKLHETAHGARFDLPTEAQWEFAARSGGREERYAGGDIIDALAWYAENSHGRTHAVGGRQPNGLGLYDMSGNVWEWCRDFYLSDAYQVHAEENPLVVAPSEERVVRGGSWGLDAWSARCTRRFSLREDHSGPGVGFRLVLLEAGGKV